MSETTNDNRTDVRINSHVNFYGPVLTFFGAPIIGLALVIFAIWAVTHWAAFIAMTPILVYYALGLFGLTFLVLVMALSIRVVGLPLVHLYHRLVEAKGQRARNKLVSSQPNYVVVERMTGELEMLPIAQEKYVHNYRYAPVQVREEEDQAALPAPLPDFVRYEDVRPQIPQGRTLVGVTGDGIETREDHVRSLLWIVGNSGTGKTNSTVIRVDDDVKRGHDLLGIDPHAFKDDSLTNALRGYASSFLRPIVMHLQDIDEVLQSFLDEFDARKNRRPPYKPLTLLVDEVGSLTMDVDPKNPLEVEVCRKVKEIGRICGQEARGFNMYGIFISQNAAGLAWLRRYALMVLAHQVLMMSERLLVCNQNREMANDMGTWPKGRTLVYGIAFREGQLLVQQPVCTPRIVDADPIPKTFFETPDAQKKVLRGNLATEVKPLIESFPATGEVVKVPPEERAQIITIAQTHMSTYGKVKRSEIPAQMKKNNRYYSVVRQVLDEEGL